MYRVRCIETGEIFDSASQAASAVGRCPSAITQAIKNKGTCAGRTWEKIIDPPYSIYKLTFPSGMVYVGQTTQTLNKRCVRGMAYKSNKRMIEAILDCGWDNIKKEILERVDTLEDALARERFYILENNSNDPERGYNIMTNFHTVATPEEKQKHRRTVRRNTSNAEPWKTVICVETGVEYESAVAAAEALGLNNSHISEVCRGTGKRFTCGGFHFTFGKVRFEGEDD